MATAGSPEKLRSHHQGRQNNLYRKNNTKYVWRRRVEHIAVPSLSRAGLEIGKKFSRISRVKSCHNFATATDVLVARATMLVAFPTVFVAVSSPEESEKDLKAWTCSMGKYRCSWSTPSFRGILVFPWYCSTILMSFAWHLCMCRMEGCVTWERRGVHPGTFPFRPLACNPVTKSWLECALLQNNGWEIEEGNSLLSELSAW